MSEEVLYGGCSCGEIRYEIAPANSRLVVCYCTSCQKQSASAYGLTANFTDVGPLFHRKAGRRFTHAGPVTVGAARR